VFKRPFSGVWTGTGTISGTGDSEQITLSSGQYMESEMVDIGAGEEVQLIDGKYDATVGSLIIKYKDGDTEANCDADTWNTYSATFISDGYVRCRVEAP
jgi:hypothetical protein